MTGRSVEKIKVWNIRVRSYIQKIFECGIKMTSFQLKMDHNFKIMFHIAKIFCRELETSFLRICVNFYGNSTRNKKVRDKNYPSQKHVLI